MHYKDRFSAYVNHELPKEERQEIAEHILQCEECRAEHDNVKLGASLAGMLRQADAPPGMWNEIETAIAGQNRGALPFFNFKGLSVAFASVIIIAGLGFVAYLALRPSSQQPLAQTQPDEVTPPQTRPNVPQVTSSPIAITPNTPANTVGPQVAPAPNSSSEIATVAGRNTPNTPPTITSPAAAAWNFETLAGTPKVGAASEHGKLAVGDFLETDGGSKARIEVADIGDVEIAPNSRVRLVNTSAKQHRLSLERGTLEAKILAPPRLFIVDTPLAVAVDLGCAYKLEVDKAGNSKLHVTSGYVALERGGRESIVPAGAMCFTRRGKGIGTPFFESATPALEAALFKFDFERGGEASLAQIITESRAEDTLTLWHLLPRVEKAERERLFDILESYVALPGGVTREGVLKLNKKMLEAWRLEMENIWFS